MRATIFLHIPKTSGSSCNRLLGNLYGPGNFIDHAEYRLPAILSGKAAPVWVDGISAHVPLCRWSLYRGSDAFSRVTMLRDPWARLVSHINWHARFLKGQTLPRGRTAGAVWRVVRALALTDFDDAGSMRSFMAAVLGEARDFNAFDNLQVRMLMTGPPRITYRRQIGGAEVAMALANLEAFALVGFCEDQDRFRARLAALLDAPAQPCRSGSGKCGQPAPSVPRQCARPRGAGALGGAGSGAARHGTATVGFRMKRPRRLPRAA